MPFLGPLPQVGAAGGILLIEQLLDKIAAVVLLGLLLLLFDLSIQASDWRRLQIELHHVYRFRHSLRTFWNELLRFLCN